MANIESTKVAADVHVHLCRTYPALSSIFELVGRPTPMTRLTHSLPVSVVKIVVGQMLSGPAAETIYARLENEYLKQGLEGPHLLANDFLRCAGLSAAKVRAVQEFACHYAANPSRFERWEHCTYDELRKDVTKLWGLSEWSASILALSHFGMPDVWPGADGSIQRAVKIIRTSIQPDFTPDHASPFRSYLARMLWLALDNSII